MNDLQCLKHGEWTNIYTTLKPYCEYNINIAILLNFTSVTAHWRLTQSPALATIINFLTTWKHYLCNATCSDKYHPLHAAIVFSWHIGVDVILSFLQSYQHIFILLMAETHIFAQLIKVVPHLVNIWMENYWVNETSIGTYAHFPSLWPWFFVISCNVSWVSIFMSIKCYVFCSFKETIFEPFTERTINGYVYVVSNMPFRSMYLWVIRASFVKTTSYVVFFCLSWLRTLVPHLFLSHPKGIHEKTLLCVKW